VVAGEYRRRRQTKSPCWEAPSSTSKRRCPHRKYSKPSSGQSEKRNCSRRPSPHCCCPRACSPFRLPPSRLRPYPRSTRRPPRHHPSQLEARPLRLNRRSWPLGQRCRHSSQHCPRLNWIARRRPSRKPFHSSFDTWRTTSRPKPHHNRPALRARSPTHTPKI
jgi:hypothetical protein